MTARSLRYTSALPRRFTKGPHLRRTARLAVVEPRRGSAVATRKGERGMTNKRCWGRRSLHAAALATIAGLCVAPVIGAGRAGAASFTVSNANDSGAGSLRAAIAAAAGAAGDDQITVQPGIGTITLATPISFAANGALDIAGNGVTVDANDNDGAIVETGGTGALSIDDMTITGAAGTSTVAGAVVVQGNGGLALSNCTITGTTAPPAPFATSHGAPVVVLGTGSTTISNCKITGNSASGAGGGDVGGGLDVEGGALVVANSEISGN